jgi:hypothetical protein
LEGKRDERGYEQARRDFRFGDSVFLSPTGAAARQERKESEICPEA